MQKLGSSHFEIVVQTYDKILNFDKRYLAQEPHWNDSAYVARTILIQAAVQTLSPDKNLLDVLDCPPFYLEKHLNYFKDKFSQYF